MYRSDGRGATNLRQLALTTSLLTRADGSARFSGGPVSVLASVAGPQEVRLRDELVDRATLDINVRPATGLPGPAVKAFADSLSYLLLPILLLYRHPRSLIQLSLQTVSMPTTKFSKPFRTFSEHESDVEEEEGTSEFASESVAEKAALINAAICALLDAAIGMKGVICAVGIALMADSTVVLDPTAEEERDAIATLCLAYSFGQDCGGQEGDVCFIETGKGSFEEEELLTAIDTARIAAQSILAFIRKSQEARYNIAA